jgi:phage terminase large subunit-like protein
MATEIDIELPEPHEAQEEVLNCEARNIVLACGRRWGKSTVGINWLAESALNGYPVAWFAPTDKYMLEIWREMVECLAPATKKANGSEHRIELVGGGVVEFWTVHNNPDAGRSRKYKRVFVDEAAKMPKLKELWNGAIRATLVDYEGQSMWGSSPKGRNYFHDLFLREQSRDTWKSFQFPTSSNPYLPRTEIADIEAEYLAGEMHEQYYLQEYMAQFVEMDGAVFKGVGKAAVHEYNNERSPSHTYVGGADWGSTNDFTVVTCVDASTKRQVDMVRFTNKDFHDQLSRVVAFQDKWKMKVIVSELNSIGKNYSDELKRAGVPLQDWLNTNATKAEVIQALARDIEMERLGLLNDKVQTNELLAFEMTRTPTGLPKYGAPEGLHDDTVIALALANQAIGSGGKVSVGSSDRLDDLDRTIRDW